MSKGVYNVTYNLKFEEVVRSCATIARKDQEGTWIHPEMITAYTQLHQLGYAHSVEVWYHQELVGGLYGIRVGNIFCGESMFSKQSNASQVGFITFLQQHSEITLVDCQVYTEYLERLGAEEIPRSQFLQIIRSNTTALGY